MLYAHSMTGKARVCAAAIFTRQIAANQSDNFIRMVKSYGFRKLSTQLENKKMQEKDKSF
jgi:hypothetical protein